MAWEEESGMKTAAKEPKHLNSNTDTCRNTAHTVWLRAFSSFPFNFSFTLFSGLDTNCFVEFPWRTSIFSFLTSPAFPHFLSACFRFPPPKCCFKSLLIKFTALWLFASSWTCFHFNILPNALSHFYASQVKIVKILFGLKTKVEAWPCQMCSTAKRKPFSGGSPDLALGRFVRRVLVNGYLVEFVHLVRGVKRSFELWTGRVGAH